MSRNARIALVLSATVVVALVAFLALKPGDDKGSGGSQPATATATTGATGTTAPPAAKETAIALVDGKPTGGVAKVVVSRGDAVVIRVTSDQPDEIHVHGYDLEEQAAPLAPAVFRFTAKAEGRYEIESHTTETQIGELTVNP